MTKIDRKHSPQLHTYLHGEPETFPDGLWGGIALGAETSVQAAGPGAMIRPPPPPPATPDSWKSAVNGNWTTAADWSAGIPGSSSDATIAVAGKCNITINSADMANSLTLNDATGTVTDTSGGTLSLTTTLAITAGTFTLSGGEIAGGTISVGSAGVFNASGGGTLNGVTYDGTLSLAAAGSGIFLDGADTFAGSNGTGAGVINLTGANAYLYAEDSTTIDNATLNFGSASNTAYIYLYPNSTDYETLTLGGHLNLVQSATGSGVTIDLDSSTGLPAQFTNEGTITASAKGGSFDIYDRYSTGTFTNLGVINISSTDDFIIGASIWSNSGTINQSGGTLQVGGTWANTGVLNLSGGTLDLGGSFDTAALSGITNTGGTVVITGALNNAGATLTIGTGGALSLAQLTGSITGGTILDSVGSLVAEGGTLDGVAYDGTLSLATANSQIFLDGVNTFAGASGTGSGVINLTGSGAVLYAEDSTTIDNATLNFGSASNSAHIYLYPNTSYYDTLTLGSHLNLVQSATNSSVIIDLDTESGGYAALLTNEGTITASAKGGTFNIYDRYGSGTFTNLGVINISSTDDFIIGTSIWSNSGTINQSGGTLQVGGTWANTGVLNLSGGTLDLGGSFDTAALSGITNTGGTVVITGALNNAGATLTIGTGGALSLAQLTGSITGGTILDSVGSLVAEGGTLDGVAYDGTLSLATANSQIFLDGVNTFAGASGTGSGVINLTGSGAVLYAEDSTTIDNATLNFGSASNSAHIYLYPNTSYYDTLTLGSHLNLVQSATNSSVIIDLDTESGGYAALLTNEGTITASAKGGTFNIYDRYGSGTFTNLGVINISSTDDFIIGTSIWSNSGTINQSGGTLQVGGTWANTGVLNLSGGTLDLGGSFDTAALSGITNTGGTVVITGALNNAGATLTIGTGGALSLAQLTGSITGGTILDSVGSLVAEGGTLDGVAYDGTLSLATANSQIFLDGVNTFAGASGTGSGVINLTGSGAVLYAEDSTTIDNATLNFGSASNSAHIYLYPNTSYYDTLTLGSHLNLVQSATNSSVIIDLDTESGGYAALLTNEGTITASAKGGTFNIYDRYGSGTFTNLGVINISSTDDFIIGTSIWSNSGTINQSGGTLQVGGTWANTGVLNLSGGTLDLGGSFDTAALSGITNTGGTVVITGALNNAGATLTIGTGGALSLAQLTGSITGGTILDSVGSLVAEGGTLDGVAYDGTLSLATANSQIFLDGVNTFAGASGTGSGVINLTGSGAVLYAEDSTTIDNATLNFGSASNSAYIYLYPNTSYYDTLTLGSHFNLVQSATNSSVIIDLDTESGGYPAVLTNEGTITASAKGGTFDIYDRYAVSTFTNLGAIVVNNTDNLTFSSVATFTNLKSGTLTAGTYSVGAGSVLQINNNASITNDAATIILSGANSVIESYNSTKATYTTLDQKLVAISSNGTLELLSGRNFTASGAFTDGGVLQLGGTTFTTATGLGISAGGTLTGYGTVAGAITDAGTVTANGGTMTLAGVTGTGAISAMAGATVDLTAGGALTESVSGAGTLKLDGATAYTLAGNNDAIATTQIDAGAALSGTGTLAGAVADAGTLAAASGTLAVTGAATGAGALTVASGATLDLAGGGSLSGVLSGAGVLKIDGAATLVLQAGATLAVAAVVVDAGATLDLANGVALAGTITGAGTLQLDGATAYTLAGVTETIGALKVDAGATLSGYGTLSAAVTDGGTVLASGGQLTVNGAVTGAGALQAASGAVLDLTVGSALAEAVSGAGVLQLDGGAYTLGGGTIGIATLRIDAGASLSGFGTVSSAVTDSGTVAAAGGTLVLSGAASGAGALMANAAAVLDLTAGGALTEAISGAGTLQLDGGAYAMVGATLGVATINVDAGATLSGNGVITGAVIDSGALAATDGVLIVDGAISGTGAMQVATVLDLLGGGTLSQTISGAGTLQLDNASYVLGGSVGVATVQVDSGATLVGPGTLGGALIDNGSVSVATGTLAIDGALSGNGGLSVATGATIDLLGGGMLAAVSGGGTLQLDSATYTLAGATLGEGATLVDSGATLSGAGTLSGAVVDIGTIAATGVLVFSSAVTGGGTLTAGSGGLIDLKAGGALSETITGAGSLQLDGATAYTLAGQADNIATVTLSKGGTLSGYGTLSGAIMNNGTIIASGGTLILGGSVTGSGALQAASGAVLDLTGGGALNNAISGAGTLELGGAYTLGSGALTVSQILIDGGASLSGAGTLTQAFINNGTIAASGGTLTIKSAIAGGTLAADAGATLNLAEGGTFAGTLAGAGTIDISTALTLGNGAVLAGANMLETVSITLAAHAAVTESAGATLSIDAASGKTLKFSGVAGTSFTNAGNVVASGAGITELSTTVINSGNISVGSGTLEFLGATTNNGVIDASAGLLSFKDAVTGTGTLEVGATGTLSLLKGAAIGQTVDFLATTGLLDLTKPVDFKGAISGFAGSDTIDLIKTLETSYTYSNGVLTVKDGTKTEASLHFSGSYTQQDFNLVSDGHGGTTISFV